MNDGRTGAVAGLREAGTLTVHLPGPPVAQGRPRFRRIGNRVATYDPAKSRAWKKVAAQLIAIEMRERGFARHEGPVQLVVVAIFPRPLRATTKRGPNPREWKVTRPDVSNMLKDVEDAATESGVWCDDSQVVRVIAIPGPLNVVVLPCAKHDFLA